MRFIRLNIILLCTFMAGCVGNNQKQMAQFDAMPGEKLPPISIWYKKHSPDFIADCRTFDSQSLLHHCHTDYVNLSSLAAQLKNSALFEDVFYGSEEIDYRLHVSSARYDFESPEELGQAAIAGASLLLIPIKLENDIKINATLTWKGFEVKNYDLTIPYEITLSLFHAHEIFEDELATLIASNLIKWLQDTNALSTKTLTAALDSSDYDKGAIYPSNIGNFQYDDTYTYHHPFLGAQTRYLHHQFQFDYIDVFAYPILEWNWEDSKTVLIAEMEKTKQGIETNKKNSGINALTFKPINWLTTEISNEVIQQQATFSNEANEKFQTTTLIYLKEDKYIKVRATLPLNEYSQSELKEFISKLQEGIVIPKESPFMSKLRKSWQDED